MRLTKKPRLADADTTVNETRGNAFDSTADLLRCLHCRQTTEFSLRLLSMLQQIADVDPFALLADSNSAPAYLREELVRKRKNALQLHIIPGDCSIAVLEYLHVPEVCVLQRTCRGFRAMVKRSLRCPRAVSYRGERVDGDVVNWLVDVYRVCPTFKLSKDFRYSASELWLRVVDEGPRINSKAVHALLDNTDVDPSCAHPFKYFVTPLWRASDANDVDLVRRLLAYPNIDLNFQDKDIIFGKRVYRTDQYNRSDINSGVLNSTALIVAALRGHEDVVSLLLADPRCDVNLLARRTKGYNNTIGAYETVVDTVLHLFTDRGVLEALLESPRVDPNMRNADGRTALHHALSTFEEGAVRALVACDRVDVNARAPRTGNTPLHLVCGFYSDDGGREFCDLLLRRKDIDKNAKNNKGESILMTAAFRGDVYMIRSLLADEEVDVDCIDDDGNTALHHAVHKSADFENMAMCIDALRDSGRFDGKVNFRNKHSETALHVLLTGKYRPREALEALLKFPDIDVNAHIDNEEHKQYLDTPLHIAVLLGYPHNVELLLGVPGIDLSVQDALKYTPVALACSSACLYDDEEKPCSRVRVFELLLNAPAPDCDLSAWNWKMLSHVASKALGTGNTSVLKMVLGATRPGIHTGAKRSRGCGSTSKRETALEYALRMNPSCSREIREEVVSIFKEAKQKGI